MDQPKRPPAGTGIRRQGQHVREFIPDQGLGVIVKIGDEELESRRSVGDGAVFLIDDLDDAVLREHADPPGSPLWEPTDAWDGERAVDRLWS